MTTIIVDPLIAQFLDYVELELGFAKSTLYTYRTGLICFHDFLGTVEHGGIPTGWSRIRPKIITTYLHHLDDERHKGKLLAPATKLSRFTAVRAFFKFLITKGAVQTDPTEGVNQPQVSKTKLKPLTVRQVEHLLEQPRKQNTPEALRDTAMLEMLYATGLRTNELVSLDIDSISIYLDPPIVHCKGKKARDRVIPINESALSALTAYLKDGRVKLVRNKGEHALFVNRKMGYRLTRQGVWLIIKYYARKAGMETLVTPNSLRQSFARHMLDAGFAEAKVQQFMGHAHLTTTHTYSSNT